MSEERLKVEKTTSFDETREIMKSTGYENSILSAIEHFYSQLKHGNDRHNRALAYGLAMSMFAVGYDICRALQEQGGQ